MLDKSRCPITSDLSEKILIILSVFSYLRSVSHISNNNQHTDPQFLSLLMPNLYFHYRIKVKNNHGNLGSLFKDSFLNE